MIITRYSYIHIIVTTSNIEFYLEILEILGGGRSCWLITNPGEIYSGSYICLDYHNNRTMKGSTFLYKSKVLQGRDNPGVRSQGHCVVYIEIEMNVRVTRWSSVVYNNSRLL